ncbi:MAG: AsmA-like C-terminal domain-containing protein [Syntrophales bacterium]|nr:AsmA-like C-terminal domain-containing protein [Syntrophales bacterium]
MSRKYKITLLLLLLLGLLIYTAPRLLSVQEIQSELIGQAGEAMDAEIGMGQMRWVWTPLPHLTLLDATVTHRDYVLRLPETRIYPDWKALLAGRIDLGSIALVAPDLLLNPSFLSPTERQTPSLGRTNVTITGGTVSIPSFAAGQVHVKKLALAGISVKIRNRFDHMAVSLRGSSSFAASLAVEGKYFPGSGAYSGTVKAEKFQLPEMMESATRTITPLPSRVDFNCDISGQGLHAAQVLFDGNIPAFALQRLENPVPFIFDRAKLRLEKKGRDLTAEIIELGLAGQDVTFSGTISRTFGGDALLPFYRLDLAATEIDLNEVRARLLELLGDEHITRTVCDVVRAGRAKSATYTFDAPLAGFKDLMEMTINVDVDNAEIHVPAVELDLSRASGPIIIEDGIIHGSGLTTWLGDHYGSNGSFSLGLSEHNWRFTLDLDIDADLATLPQTLHHLIDDDNFRREVVKFSSQGRKMGHLTIGDDLRNFTVDVRIPDLQGSTVNYERISWPINLQGGMLHIYGHEVEWRQFAAEVGPHKLVECSGNLLWGESGIPFTVNSVAATLEATSFLNELMRYPLIAATLSPSIASAEGRLVVSKGEVNGPFISPADWQYTLSAGLENMIVTSPQLPAPVPVSRGTLEMDRNHVSLADASLTFLDSPLALSATLSHNLFADWSGRLVLDGPISSAQGAWLAGKNWIPALFFPKIPCEIKKFAINFAEEDLDISGTLANKSLSGLPIEAVVEVNVTEGRHMRSSLHFFKKDQDGLVTISGDSRTSAPEIAFQGRLDWETLAAIFTRHTILNGELTGLFKLTLPMQGKNGFSFTGRAEARDLEWLWGNSLRKVAVSRAALRGDREHLRIDDLSFSFENEKISGAGGLQFHPQEVALDLSAHAETLSQHVLTNFIDDFSVFLKKFKGGQEDGDANWLSRKITGGIKLEAEQFQLAETIRGGKAASYKLTPFAGRIDFSDPKVITLFLIDSNFCGLAIDGTLKWRDNGSSKEFLLKNPADSRQLFEEFLPCAGVKTTLISGPFTVNASLTDENGTLSSGTLHLQAENGILQKMDLLSKIFKLINFTDLYQGLFSRGFRYKVLKIDGHVANNLLILDKAVMEGEGMDIIAQGTINLPDLESNLTIFIVPFKSIDKIINMVPWVGRIIGGKKRHILTYPVRVTGNLREPELSMLSPTAIGKAAIDFVFDTITFPLDLLPSMDVAEPAGEEKQPGR